MKRIFAPLFIAACGLAPASHAADGIAVGIGNGNDVDMVQVALTRSWDRQWFTEGDGYLTGYWEVSLAHWDPQAAGGQRILDLGFAPVFRLQSKAQSGWRSYLEGAIGVHLVSHTHVDAGRDLGSAFQFGDHVGIGLMFGQRGQLDLGYRFQHVSNADIKDPNSGVNFHQLRLGYLF
ncbi:MAG: hypothetical protein BGP21_08855 [Thiobacillus sp. 65-29]|jgi:hypothetical protein|nr:MAG: hypothetical protein BGP21_08855 [Thiobacillus sp. 65-29]